MKNIDIFPWDDHFNTGIETIDIQHRKLVQLLNRLATLVAYQSTKDELNAIFDELTEYTLYHFQTEESIWHKHLKEDPLYNQHQAVHQNFIDTIKQLKDKQEIKPLCELADEALGFLARWLASHILESDRYMAHVVKALQDGLDINGAKVYAKEQLSGSSRVLIEIILSIYSTLSTNTLHLMRELQHHTFFENKVVYQDHYHELLIELATSFINIPLDEIDTAIQSALGKIATFIGTDRAYIFDYDIDAKTTTNTYEWCEKGIKPHKKILQKIPLDKFTDWVEIHSRGEHFLIEDVFALAQSEARDTLLMQDIQSLVTFPLMEKNRCKGFVGFDAVKQKHTFTNEEIALLKLFSSLLANISDRKTTETALLYERGFLKTLIQAIPDLVWMKDLDGIYLVCNGRFEAFFGAKETEILGKTDYDFVEKSLADFFRMHDKTVMQSAQPNVNEEEIPFASDGHKEILQTTKVPVYDANNNLIGVLGVGRDITALKHAQKELERKERYQRAVLDNFPFFVWLKDEQSQFLAVNQPFADACKIESVDTLVGKTDLDIWPQELAISYRKDDAEVLASKKPKNIEKLLKTGDSSVWIETYKSPVTLDGNVIGTVGFARDITDKKLLEISNQEVLDALKRAEAMAKIGNWTLDLTTGKHGWSDGVFNIFELDKESVEPSFEAFMEVVHPEDREMIHIEYQSTLITKEKYKATHRLLMKDGRIKYIKGQGISDLNETGKPFYLIGTVQDITEQWHLEEAQRIAATVFESQEGMMVTDVNAIILKVNRAFTEITGYGVEEAVGRTPSFLGSGRHKKLFYTTMWQAILGKGAWEGEVWNRRKNGEVYPQYLRITAVKDNYGKINNFVATLSDITLSKAASEEIKSLAFYDPLTKLPNRRLLMDRLHQALISSTRSGHQGALLFMDLDHFKTLNDTLGHAVGDILLEQVAKRLTSTLREGDTAARIGGDEFVVLLEDLSKESIDAAAQTKQIAEKIHQALNQPYQLGKHTHHITPSIGVILFNEHEQHNIDDLLKQADIAMYEAKAQGRNTIRFFDPNMQEVIAEREAMKQSLHKAIVEHQFELYYQTQVASNAQVIGVEALIRWHHPERGMILPLDFIPLAEETGLILPIGQWVLESACAQLQSWQNNPLTKQITISINVSAKQFSQSNFVEQVLATVKQYAIDPKYLKIELTESMLVENIDDIIVKMRLLNETGIRFSLDDFGTGYSSLQYLKLLPIDQLKIDKSFVRDINHDKNDSAIVITIINVTQGFELDVIAEGVETEEQRAFLFEHGCTHYQGYLFGKPMPIDMFETLLK